MEGAPGVNGHLRCGVGDLLGELVVVELPLDGVHLRRPLRGAEHPV